MTMPETAMDEDHGVVSRENQVRTSGQTPVVKPKPETPLVQTTAHQHFGLGILASNTCHHATACRSIHNIRLQAAISAAFLRLIQHQATAPCALPPLPRQVRQQRCRTGDKLGYPKRG